MKNPKIVCNECNKEFKLKTNRIKKEKLTDDIQGNFFKCPYCKHKFIFMYTDSEIRENLKNMDQIKARIEIFLKQKKDVTNLISKYEKLYYRNLNISNRYKEIYKS